MATTIQLRRGNSSNWTSSNPILAEGEIGLELDTHKFKIGDGVQHWNTLVYGIKGDQGIQGIQGIPGIQGIKGDKGDTGSQGIQGLIGNTGLQGIQGISGYTPVKGVDYFDGAQGLKGDKGDQGNIGLTGGQGIQGIQGVPGTTDYNALSNKPTIPTNTNQLTNGAGFLTSFTETDPIFTAWDKSTGISITKSQISDFPTIPAAQVQTDWNASSGMGQLLNKPTIPTNTNQLTNGAGFITSYAETDPIVKAINGIVKSNGTTISAAVSGTDYVIPSSTINIGTTAVTINRASGALTLAGITLTTPNIGAATGTSVVLTGAITSSGAGIGYASGAGGTVTQSSSRTTGVTLSKLCGNITMFSSAVAAQGVSTFTLTNSFIAATDFIMIQHISSTNGGAWQFSVVAAAGSAAITVRNVTTASITEATPLRFVVIKAVTA
jgi:hypothetical protein